MKTSFSKIHSLRLYSAQFGLALVLSTVVAIVLPNFADSNVGFWLVQLGMTMMFGLLTFCYACLEKASYVTANKLDKMPKPLDTLFVVVALFFLVNAMTPINEWFCNFLESLGLNRPDVAVTNEMLTSNPILAILTICIVAPILEEVTFRGTIAHGLFNSAKNKTGAIVCSGLLFAIFHMNPAQTLHQFVVGVLLTVVAIYASVQTAIVGHIFNNSLAVVLSLTVEDSGFYQHNAVLVAILGMFLFVATVVGYYFYLKKTNRLVSSQPVENVKVSVADKVLFGFAIAFTMLIWALSLVAVN